MTISPTGQLYSLSTDSTGTLGIDTYDMHSGKFLGRVSGAGTFSADQGFNPGGHAAMFINSGYLYFTTGTGKYVWIFAIPPGTCPQGQGFWKNESTTKWPVSSLMLGSQTYTAAHLQALLGEPDGGDASLTLAHQLIAADLNLVNGAYPGTILPVIQNANTVLSEFSGFLPYGVKPPTTAGKEMTTDANDLAAFNGGKPAPPTPGPSGPPAPPPITGCHP